MVMKLTSVYVSDVVVQYTYNAPVDVATTSGTCVDMRGTHTQV